MIIPAVRIRGPATSPLVILFRSATVFFEDRTCVNNRGETIAGKHILELRSQWLGRKISRMIPLWLHEVDMGIPEPRDECLPRTIDRPHALWGLKHGGLPDADNLSACNDNDAIHDWLGVRGWIDAGPY